MVVNGPEQLELALRLFRDYGLMAKREARRRKYVWRRARARRSTARKRATRNRH